MISSALSGSILSVYSWLAVRSLSLTLSLFFLTWQCFALQLIAMKLSTSVISDGILFPLINALMDVKPLLSVLVALENSIDVTRFFKCLN
jgi:hypothetical protein